MPNFRQQWRGQQWGEGEASRQGSTDGEEKMDRGNEGKEREGEVWCTGK